MTLNIIYLEFNCLRNSDNLQNFANDIKTYNSTLEKTLLNTGNVSAQYTYSLVSAIKSYGIDNTDQRVQW